MIRVTTKQLSQLCGKKVFTRADCYLASIDSNIDELLTTNNYLLSEDILKSNHISYKQIPYSGVSIKMTTSNSFQILKVGPNSFNSLFGSYELGAGASLFCLRCTELNKNADLIRGWNTSVERMNKYFNNLTKDNTAFHLDQDICKAIKNYSCAKIKEMIESNENLQLKVFNGVSLYEEPYTAFYFFHGKDLSKLTSIPFSVTTGSGRSKGDYTIVLKP
jgi:hypothetical protein